MKGIMIRIIVFVVSCSNLAFAFQLQKEVIRRPVHTNPQNKIPYVHKVLHPLLSSKNHFPIEKYTGRFEPFEGCSSNSTDLKIGDHGIIMTPNYPNNYTSNLDCIWFIESVPGTKIEVTFFDFDTQTSASPWFFTYFDYVLISRDGTFSKVDTMAGDLNDRLPLSLESEENKFGIRFKSSRSVNYRGFKLKYVVKPQDPTGFSEPSPFNGVCGQSYVLEPDYVPKSSSNSSETNNRITGDNPAPPFAYPWMVALFSSGRFICGGSIIDDQHILTAAQCTNQIQRLAVLLGSYNFSAPKESEPSRKIMRVTEENIFQHPSFDRETISHDISILRLPEKIIFSDKILPICLPNRYQLWKTFQDDYVEVSGWGKTSDANSGGSPVLQNTTVKVISNEKCRSFFGSDITGNQMCTTTTPSSSPCDGDGGGPLFVRQASKQGNYYMQVGILSFGAVSCERYFPAGYTRLTAFLDFIESVTGREHTI